MLEDIIERLRAQNKAGDITPIFCKWCSKLLMYHYDSINTNHYCSATCYQSHRDHVAISDKNKRNQSVRYNTIARRVSQAKPGDVVHHIDGDITNNNIDNLRLFGSQSEHLKYHHSLRN